MTKSPRDHFPPFAIYIYTTNPGERATSINGEEMSGGVFYINGREIYWTHLFSVLSITYSLQDTTDNSYETMHSKCEELEIRNYQDALHYSASSKKLKRHCASVLTQKPSSSSYGWSSRRFPLCPENVTEEETSHPLRPADSNSPIEDAVFSTPHISHSYKSQQ